MTVDLKPAALDPNHIVSHAQYAQERGMRPKTFNELRRSYPALFPNAIQRGFIWYATRAEFDAFLDALRGTATPRIAARAAARASASASDNAG